MIYKYKNFYYEITHKPKSGFSLHIRTDDVCLFAHPYKTQKCAIAAAEHWIETVHKTVLDYHRGA